MTPRSRADCTTLTVEDSTGLSLMSTCWSKFPAPSHIISVLDGLKRSLLADVQLLTSVIGNAHPTLYHWRPHWCRFGCHLHTDVSAYRDAPPLDTPLLCREHTTVGPGLILVVHHTARDKYVSRYVSMSYLPRTVREWNTSPEHIVNLGTVEAFKHAILVVWLEHWVLHCIIQCRELSPYPEEQNILFLICICTCIAAPPSYSCTCLFPANRLSLQLYQPLTMPWSLHPIEVVGSTARKKKSE